jgi:predicted ATPase
MDTLYIPAGRSFFTMLSKRIFSLIKEGVTFDKLISGFGSEYEQNKKLYKDILEQDNYLQRLINKVLKGSFLLTKENDEFIQLNNGIKIELSQLSSGQQEVLPAIIVLISALQEESFIIFEEPEAHLFPTDQKALIELIIYVAHKFTDTKVLITTHSPYILSSLNNLIQARNSLSVKNDKKTDISNIVKQEIWIDFKDVNAYQLSQTEAPKEILDLENRLIDSNYIDEASSIIGEEFDSLLDIEFEEE